jgi:hypothetical protein
MLQTHGGEIRWRNIFVREIDQSEAQRIAAEGTSQASPLASALSLHASFDFGLDADFSRGDRTCYVQKSGELWHAAPTSDVQVVADGGRFGGSLFFAKKNSLRPAYRDAGALQYNDDQWNASVSVWLRLNPDEDLEPGYCDPVQIVGDDTRNGFIFLEFSKDETPRFFRYAVRPRLDLWNPHNTPWEELPFEKRPMVQVERPPFSRENWTHVVFTLENVNSRSRSQVARLYLNGTPRGSIENRDLTFAWKAADVLLVLGASYVGHIDDLAVFNRVLTDSEVMTLNGLKQGVRTLYVPPAE